ncbi:fumarate reductase flavoprotein subunit [Thecamonas trahens ATCC 50062]|uniref:Fumarate reductase flavoprotein subunit n=1 Tax=Thecamonas trahens ATCC 50062 TaxID=461836 RepID=A0A0L0DIJ1_THETB|nr:fumarate reductase flavoprotein subunit [Thecamonas trahens ATCC 50062]KNC51921.1 fumarate reductase flavoprotein subunit [Thecamonas trahens ATCC 50062]|eukprot:XP_013755517.1 fumarate reductase flavoprotein subunit [Thecamonas trahens ATCC 50062]
MVRGSCLVSVVAGAKDMLSIELLTPIMAAFGVEASEIKVLSDFATAVPHGEAVIGFASPADAAKAARILDGAAVGELVLAVKDVSAPAAERTIAVIGAGLAGASAALSAAELGATVIVLDKEARGGGNSAKASSGINGAGTAFQAEVGIDDSPALLIADTMASGKDKADPKLVHKLAHDSAAALAWIEKTAGVALNAVVATGGHSVARTHRMAAEPGARPVNLGWGLMRPLLDAMHAHPNICVVNGATAVGLDTAAGVAQVRGVVARIVGADAPITLAASAVVLATGGYAACSELLPDHVAGLPTTNGAFATGDGIELAKRVGGLVGNLDAVQVHPTGFVDVADPGAGTKFLAPEALRGYGGVLATPDGELIVDELATRDVVSAAIRAACEPASGAPSPVAVLLMNAEVASGFDPAIFDFYVSKGLIHSFGSMAELGAWADGVFGGQAGTDGARRSKAYEAAMAARGRAVTSPMHAALITPAVHYTMGGVGINPDGAVLHAGSLVPIPGLYAAGEVTTGVHGANRLAGNSLLECVVYGRAAGRSAVLHPTRLPALSPTEWVSLELKSVTPLSSSSSLFSFALPSAHHISGLGLGDYVKIRAEVDGAAMVRFYSPISRDDALGHLDLCVKTAAADAGGMAAHFGSLAPGDILEFSGPAGGPHLSMATTEKTAFGLLAGGTGIAPMLQLIRAALLKERKIGTATRLDLVYAAKNEDEILLREVLEAHAAKHPSLSLYYALMEPPAEWDMGVGFITPDMMAARLPPPAPSTMILICGPPPFCAAMRRGLDSLGYLDGEHYYSYC